MENLSSISAGRVTHRARDWFFICAIAVWLCGCSDTAGDPVAEFTQCIHPFGTPPQFTRHLQRDDQHKCYGHRWRMPREQRAYKHVAYPPVAEEFTINLPDGTPLESITDSLRVWPVLSTPDRALTERIDVYMQVRHLNEPPEQRFGMSLKQRKDGGQVSDALFIREQPPRSYVLCRPTPKRDGTRRLERSVCAVFVAFDDVALVEFSMHYAQLENHERVVNDVLALLDGYRIRKEEIR